MTVDPEYDLGVVGGGVAARMAAEALASFGKVAITFLSDTDPSTFPKFAHLDRALDLFRPGACRAIYIATPVSSHLFYLKLALERGLPTLIEKPITVNAQEALEIDPWEAGRLVAVAFRKRHSALAAAIRSYRNSRPEAPCHIRCVWLAPHPGEGHWKAAGRASGGGISMDVGCHALDLFEFCIGPIADIGVAQCDIDTASESDIYVRLNVTFESSPVSKGEIVIGWAARDSFQAVDFVQDDFEVRWAKDGSRPEGVLTTTSKSSAVSATSRRVDEYLNMLGEFRRFIDGQQAQIATWQDGLRNQRLLDSIAERMGLATSRPLASGGLS